MHGDAGIMAIVRPELEYVGGDIIGSYAIIVWQYQCRAVFTGDCDAPGGHIKLAQFCHAGDADTGTARRRIVGDNGVIWQVGEVSYCAP